MQVDPVYVDETFTVDGALLWTLSHHGRAIATTTDRRQLDALLEAVQRPVRWVVAA